MSWKPRASGLGASIKCDMIAAFDRAIDEGLIEVSESERQELKAGNKYTDFGTVCHYVLMDGSGCLFPGPSKDYAPTPEEVQLAAGMTGGDIPQMWVKAREVATLAAAHLPKAPDGKPWLSEVPMGKDPNDPHPFSGTADFLSHDYSELGDLKTTSKPPDGRKVKTVHLVQLICYAQLVEWHMGVRPATGWVLYVSSKADWCLPPIRINFAVLGDYFDQVVSHARYLIGPDLFQRAMPRILDAGCGDVFCRHTARCRDIIRPDSVEQVNTRPSFNTAPVKSVNIFAKKGPA